MFKNLSILTKISDNSKDEELEKGVVKANEQSAVATQEEDRNVEERVMMFSEKNKTEKTKISAVEENPIARESVLNKNPRIRVYKPTHYDIVTSIGTDIVRNQKAIVLDMTNLDEKTTMKIIQFVSGICYALNIEPEELAPKMILIDPTFKVEQKK